MKHPKVFQLQADTDIDPNVKDIEQLETRHNKIHHWN